MDALPLLNALIRRPVPAAAEARILELLRGASDDHLDALVRGVDTRRLFDAVDDRLVGPDHRTALVELLTAERVEALSLPARAAVAYGLQAGPTWRAEELGIRNLLLATRGVRLTHLKNLLNSRPDAHDLEALVFGDIDDPALRDQILDHIAAEAVAVVPGKAKVLSDIDDTVVCALHDRRYPKGTVYPGALALFDALDAGPTDEPFSTGDLTFVTARPGDAFGLIENSTRAALRRAGVTTASVLTGSLVNLITHDAMAAKKLANIDHHHRLFPEYRIVFLGDSGQGDAIVGSTLRRERPEAVDLVLIHDVVDTGPERRAELAGRGVRFFDTYVGAAVLCRDHGLISDAGLARVVDETRTGLAAVAWRSVDQERVVRELVARDVAAAS